MDEKHEEGKRGERKIRGREEMIRELNRKQEKRKRKRRKVKGNEDRPV
jgi:hypothetical protein